MPLQFTSLLPGSHRTELEELLFQHPQQGRFLDTILDSIEKYGVPHVVERNGGLRVELAEQTEVQTLYAVVTGALESELVGALVYTLNAAHELAILHIAVKDGYTVRGSRAGHQVTFALVEELCRIAARIRGVIGVRLAYARGKSMLQKVHPLTWNASTTHLAVE